MIKEKRSILFRWNNSWKDDWKTKSKSLKVKGKFVGDIGLCHSGTFCNKQKKFDALAVVKIKLEP